MLDVAAKFIEEFFGIVTEIVSNDIISLQRNKEEYLIMYVIKPLRLPAVLVMTMEQWPCQKC